MAASTQTMTGFRFHARTPAVSAPMMPIHGLSVSTVKTPGKIRAVIAVYGISFKNFSSFPEKFILSTRTNGSSSNLKGRPHFLLAWKTDK